MDLIVWFLLALPLALDVFAVGLVFGLAGLARSRWLGVAVMFAAIGGVLIATGLILGDALEGAAGSITLYLAAAVLLAIGIRSLKHGLQRDGAVSAPSLTTGKIAATAVAIAIDKFAVGLSFAVLEAPIAPLIVIVAVQAFAATFIGLKLGKRFGARAGDAAEIIAGVVFVGFGLIVLFKAVSSRA